MNLSFFIAKRLYADKDNTRRMSRPAVLIAMLGIAVGIAVMVISIAVVMGFKKEVTDKIVGFGSDIQVLSITQDDEFRMLPVVTNDSLHDVICSIPGVKSVQPFATLTGILKTEDNFLDVQMQGVGKDYDLSFFSRYLTEGRMPDFSFDSKEILISRKIASDLGLSVDDKVFAYFVNSKGMRARRFLISGIYETHLSEYDQHVVIVDISIVRSLCGWKDDESSGYHITVNNFDSLQQITDRVTDRVNHQLDRNGSTYTTMSIRELSPGLFSWLGVLDTNVDMILVLMLFISSFTIISGLLIIMLERIRMIGVLKSLGMTNIGVRRIFVHFSIMMVGRGMLYGNIIALLFCFIQHHFHLIGLDASVYYINFIPISFEWLMFVGVNLLTIIITSVIIFGSSFLMSLGSPAKTMSFE